MKKQLKILAIASLVITFTACMTHRETTNTASSKRKTQNVSQLFKQMDVNNDGKISKIEAKGKIKKNFKLRDKNNDGFISRSEMTGKK